MNHLDRRDFISLLIALGQTVLIIGLRKTVFGVEITNNLMTVFYGGRLG